MVQADDTISIGAFASAPNLWGSINDCNAYTYGCGAAQTIAVTTPPPDVCVDDHTPGTPAGLAAAQVGSCGNSTPLPKNTQQLKLSWNKVSPPADCTNFYYRGYQCLGAGCTPTVALPGFFTSEAANCSGTTCTSNIVDAGSNLNARAYRYAVSAVCEINNCSTAPTTRTWEGLASTVVGDPCP